MLQGPPVSIHNQCTQGSSTWYPFQKISSISSIIEWGTRPTETSDLSIKLKYRGAEWKVPKMGQQTSKSTTPTFDRGVNSTEIRFNDPTLLQEPRSGFRVQGSGFRVQSSEFRVFSIHIPLTSLDPTMLQEPPVSIHNQCTIAVHNSSSMTRHPLPSI